MSQFATIFDAVAIAVILISALMALARGFMRELATLGAFIGALAAAYYAHVFFAETVRGLMPDGAPGWVGDAILVVLVFVVIYSVIAWFGSRLSRNIQGLDGIGMLDRVAGFAFGLARGAVAVVFFVLLVGLTLEKEDVPGWIQDGRTYPFFDTLASYVRVNAPRVAEDVRDSIPLDEEDEQR